jgi:glycosyltransferase involved in cell wall biosynthesis
LNIGIIHPFFKVIAGAEKTTFSLLDALEKTSHSLTLYAITAPNYAIKPNYNIKITHRKKIPYFSNYQKMKMVKQLFHDIQNEDIVIISSGGFTLEPTKVKRIIHYCHSSFEEIEEYLNTEFSGIRKFYNKTIQNNLKKSIQLLENENVKLVSNSKYTEESIMKLFHKKSSIVIYPPVDIKKFSKYSDVKKKKLVITLNRLSPEKNMMFALTVMIKADQPYILAGFVKKENQPYYDQLSDRIKRNFNIKIQKNIDSSTKEHMLSESKVYFHTAKESFGISVVEAISAGCIPIVPDNSAHKETVPFEELRYKENDVNDARNKIEEAINGKFDHYLPQLKKHIEKFSTERFQSSMVRYIESIS